MRVFAVCGVVAITALFGSMADAAGTGVAGGGNGGAVGAIGGTNGGGGAANGGGSALNVRTETVNILEDAFFPPTVFLKPGMDLEFYNATDVVQTVSSVDGSWSVGPIAPGETGTIKYNGKVAQDGMSYQTDDLVGEVAKLVNVTTAGLIEDRIGGNYDVVIAGQ